MYIKSKILFSGFIIKDDSVEGFRNKTDKVSCWCIASEPRAAATELDWTDDVNLTTGISPVTGPGSS